VGGQLPAIRSPGFDQGEIPLDFAWQNGKYVPVCFTSGGSYQTGTVTGTTRYRNLPPSPLSRKSHRDRPTWNGESVSDDKQHTSPFEVGIMNYHEDMGKDGIVTGQKVSQEKQNRARELRQTMTPAERQLWSKLRANRLEGWHFRR
jgi:hypothetical protein